MMLLSQYQAGSALLLLLAIVSETKDAIRRWTRYPLQQERRRRSLVQY